MAAKPEDDNKNSTQTAELISKNESHNELEITGNLNLSEGPTAADIVLSESLQDTAWDAEKEKLEDEYIHNHLKNYLWYHGVMFCDMTEKLLKWDHSFLVRRKIIKNGNKIFCLSMKIEDKIFHYQIAPVGPDAWTCPKLMAKFPKIPPRKFVHIHEIIDNWSLFVHLAVPVPRDKMIVHHESITLGQKLGKGAFGEVFKAQFVPKDSTESIEVAVKQSIRVVRREIHDFCKEASIMSKLSHRNIVGFYGFASLKIPLILVMELVPGGDLKNYLQKTKNISNGRLMSFVADIIRGMAHLSWKKVLHRDLAARNCLITNDLMVKISDFGLSVIGEEHVLKHTMEKAPTRWLAPETLLKGVFNEKTEVFTFGVVCSEILTRCEHEPLFPRAGKDVAKWIKTSDHPHVISNPRLEPKELYDLIARCTDKNIEIRPTFSQLKKRLVKGEKGSDSKTPAPETAKLFDGPIGPPIAPSPPRPVPGAPYIPPAPSHTLPTNPSTPGPAPHPPTAPSPDPVKKVSNQALKKAANTTLTRKKSRDKNRTKERKNKAGGGKLLSFRRKEQKAKLPPGMSPTTPSPSTPPPK